MIPIQRQTHIHNQGTESSPHPLPNHRKRPTGIRRWGAVLISPGKYIPVNFTHENSGICHNKHIGHLDN